MNNFPKKFPCLVINVVLVVVVLFSKDKVNFPFIEIVEAAF